MDAQYSTRSFIPAPVRFNGMPDTRWWAFEDGKTNFGDINPGTTDLAKLLLIEFGLVYANDWFLLPYTVPAGTALNIKGLAVTNTFGERFWIEAAGPRQRRSVAALDDVQPEHQGAGGRARRPRRCSCCPPCRRSRKATPLEEIALTRDEMANMVWGIETVIPLPSGGTRAGNVAAGEFHDHLQALLDAAAACRRRRSNGRPTSATTS